VTPEASVQTVAMLDAPPRLSASSPVVLDIARAMAGADAAHRRLRAVLSASVGLSGQEFNAVMLIERGDHTTPKLLAQSLDITTGAVTAMTDRLVSAGLIERSPNPSDRRSLLLHLSPLGARACAAIYEQYTAALARVLDASGDLDTAAMTAFLERTAGELDRTADAIPALLPAR
jgi:DNA-binding MarR family transcriptional regulator